MSRFHTDLAAYLGDFRATQGELAEVNGLIANTIAMLCQADPSDPARIEALSAQLHRQSGRARRLNQHMSVEAMALLARANMETGESHLRVVAGRDFESAGRAALRVLDGLRPDDGGGHAA